MGDRDDSDRDDDNRYDNDRDDSEEGSAGFDQTNGMVDGLDGDDGGALDPDGGPEDVVTNVVKGLAEDDGERGQLDDGETPYSEEGRP